MRINARIAVEKVFPSPGTYSFKSELMEVTPLRILRRRCGSSGEALRRFYYQADILAPKEMHPDYSFALFGPEKNTLRVNIERKSNPRWKPPAFPAGQDIVEIDRPVDRNAPTPRVVEAA